MGDRNILCDIGQGVQFLISGRSEVATIHNLEDETYLKRIYRIQFKTPPQKAMLEVVASAIKAMPDIELRFYGDYSEELIPWDMIKGVERLSVDLWHTESLNAISSLPNLRTLAISKNVRSKVSLKIIEPLENLEVLFTSISKDIESVSNLKRLVKVNLSEVKTDNLNFLKTLTQLKTVNLSLGSYSSFDGLTKLPKLNRMHIHQVRGFDDEVTSQVLANCQGLEALMLDNLTHITQLNFAQFLSGLKYLTLEGVKNLDTYDPLQYCKSLEIFTGYNCRPKDQSLTGLRNLKAIALGDSYPKTEVENFLKVSLAGDVNIRGKMIKGDKPIRDFFHNW